MINSTHKRFGSWLAILAMLLISFAPLASQAISSSTKLDKYDVICSSSGIKLVNTGQSGSNDTSKIHPLIHCNYCSLSVDKVIIGIAIQTNGINKEEVAFIFQDYHSPSVVNYFLVTQLPNAPPSI
ncbi:MAG: DUF2946 domain-containing protein [Methylophilales bacterium]|jgi:hypothetical protein|nr:DUF2946 domain-containing protein [Pseudomonadota bacterium]NQW34421.1 DUF2946 domain-containing protein [Methylophilales bacterium]HCK03244.1 hypothetical protein [Methylophilaceae bacterium]|tara:strand:+ start:7948 stop:8325 length:378 start_codon:yes stop_codon:yes gene_type:complete